MIPIANSPASPPNATLARARPGPTDEQCLARRAPAPRASCCWVGPRSSTSAARVAQSGLRGDLTPSYWSLCGLLVDEGRS